MEPTSIYRSHTLGQNYNFMDPDQSVSAAGSQNMSFSFDGERLLTRIDRSYVYNDYWIWAHPDLQPIINFTLVIHDGPRGFACFNRGQNNFYAEDPRTALGYADTYLTDYLVRQSHQFALPWLLKKFTSDPKGLHQSVASDASRGVRLLALQHAAVDVVLLVNATTMLPYALRTREEHTVFGDCTNDLLLSAWADVSICSTNCSHQHQQTVFLPHRLQTVYDSHAVLEDYLIDSITINAADDAFFEPASDGYLKQIGSSSSSDGGSGISSPADSYPAGDVHEFYESGLWNWPMGLSYTASDVVVYHPFPDFNAIMTIYAGPYPDYVQLLVEHESGLIITDAAPYRSHAVLAWIAANMRGKKITHVVPSHHHRDHAGGVNDYVAAGAILVVPEVARELYNLTDKVPLTQMLTYNETNPFQFRDGHVQFHSFWRASSPHAQDWSFSVATKARPTTDEHFVLFNADVVSPGSDAARWDTMAARQFLIDAVKHGVPRSTLLVGAHGSTQNGTSTSEALIGIADTSAFLYPPLTHEDWTARNG